MSDQPLPLLKTLHVESVQTYLAVSVESLSKSGPVAELLSKGLNCVLFYRDENGVYVQWKPDQDAAELARLKRIEDAAKGLLECLSESEKHYIEAEINALSDAIKKP